MKITHIFKSLLEKTTPWAVGFAEWLQKQQKKLRKRLGKYHSFFNYLLRLRTKGLGITTRAGFSQKGLSFFLGNSQRKRFAVATQCEKFIKVVGEKSKRHEKSSLDFLFKVGKMVA